LDEGEQFGVRSEVVVEDDDGSSAGSMIWIDVLGCFAWPDILLEGFSNGQLRFSTVITAI
jgi:hypothetical protein